MIQVSPGCGQTGRCVLTRLQIMCHTYRREFAAHGACLYCITEFDLLLVMQSHTQIISHMLRHVVISHQADQY